MGATWRNVSRLSPSVPETVHDGHEVSVIRPLTAGEADLEETGPMYRVLCLTDGAEFDAFADELEG